MNNRAFTNYLRNQLSTLADSQFDHGQTLGHYCNRYPDQMNRIKRELVKYVPIEKSYTEAWKKASQALSQERAEVKKKRTP